MRAQRVIGVDGGTSQTGLALVRSAPQLEGRVVALRSVAVDSDDVVGSVRYRILPQLLCWSEEAECAGEGISLWLERPPPTARKDVAHGFQGAIGDAQGWIGGLIAGASLDAVDDAHRVYPSDWRKTMMVLAAQAGRPLQMPRRGAPAALAPLPHMIGAPKLFRIARSAKNDLVRRWVGCGHDESFPGLLELQRAVAASCPACDRAPTKGDPTEAEALRDAWKALACLFVGTFWPELYQVLVANARSRARTEKPDHKLVGVADACEAVGVALHGLCKAEEVPDATLAG